MIPLANHLLGYFVYLGRRRIIDPGTKVGINSVVLYISANFFLGSVHCRPPRNSRIADKLYDLSFLSAT